MLSDSGFTRVRGSRVDEVLSVGRGGGFVEVDGLGVVLADVDDKVESVRLFDVGSKRGARVGSDEGGRVGR